MGNIVSNMQDDIDAHQAKVYMQNRSAGFEAFCESAKLDMKIEDAEKTTEKEIKQELKDGKADYILYFRKVLRRAFRITKRGIKYLK